MPEIILKNVTKTFDHTNAVDHLNLVIKDRDFITLLGPSGCGKTTTLRMIAGLETPTSGEIIIDGQTVFSSEKGIDVPPQKRNVGFLFQNYALWPHMTVLQNITFGLENLNWEKEKIRERSSKLMKMLQIEEYKDRYPAELSGGQQQRVAIARAIVNEPEVLLLDEPLAALDLKMRKDMQMELKEMHKRLGITFVYVTHDQEEALTLSDTIVVMSEGRIQQIGTPIDIYNEPTNSFVADFIGESNILNGTMVHDCLVRFCGHDFECVDKNFGNDVPVDVVVRPEDLYIFPVSDMAQLRGVVQSCIFKGVHYEMTVLVDDYELLVQDYHAFEAGTEVGLLVKPFDIHIMHKERTCNEFEAAMVDETHVEFLGCTFECPRVDMSDVSRDWGHVKVEVDFDKIILQDNAEDGMLTGEVKFILYKGNHYHLTVCSDWDENVFVDTNDVWDDGDHVGITIPADAIRVI